MRAHRVLLGALAVVLLVLLPAGAASAGSSDAHTVPAANEVVAAAPDRVEIIPPHRATTGTARVRRSDGELIAAGPLTRQAGGRLALALPVLGNGIYQVSWTAGADAGAFAFNVDSTGASPPRVTQPVVHPKLKTEATFVGWLPITAVMIVAGALGLIFLVTARATAGLGDGLRAGVELRLVRVAAVAAGVLAPTTVAAAAYGDGSFDWGSVWPALRADPAGHVLAARFVLSFAALLLIVSVALRRTGPPRAVAAAGLACALGELLLRGVPTKSPPVMSRAVFDSVMYTGHMWGAAFWIGGLVALLALAVRSPIPTPDRAAFWPRAIGRFSVLAMASVAALVLSGLWLYWVHIDGVRQLVSTLYGRTLLVKFALIAALLVLGALNQFWLLPRLVGRRAAGDRSAVLVAVRRHFRAAIAAEVVLGLAVLLVAGLLSGSARNQQLQAGPDQLARHARVGAHDVTLIPSGQQPGLTDYEVRLAGGPAAQRVTVAFSSPALGIPPTTVTAPALAVNRFRVSGLYTPVVGAWRIAVAVDGGTPAEFALAITEKAPAAPRAPTKPVRWTTWSLGAVETVLVALLMLTSFRIARRLTQRQISVAARAARSFESAAGPAAQRAQPAP